MKKLEDNETQHYFLEALAETDINKRRSVAEIISIPDNLQQMSGWICSPAFIKLLSRRLSLQDRADLIMAVETEKQAKTWVKKVLNRSNQRLS
jgi:hypothetical protein